MKEKKKFRITGDLRRNNAGRKMWHLGFSVLGIFPISLVYNSENRRLNCQNARDE